MKQLYNRYFPTPAYLAMNSFGLDISDQSIKYGELLPTPHGLRLGRFGKERIPAGVIVSGKIENEEVLVKLLTEVRMREGLRFVRVGLPEEQVYLFTLALPSLPGQDLREVILLQLEEHIPISAPDTVFDYEIISESNKTIFVKVLAIASRTIESYLSVFRRAGLVPLSFELEAQAIARAVVPKHDPSPVIIVDVGETRAGISIVNSGNVLFTTTLDIGGASLTKMIAKNFNISIDEAEALKRSYGAANDPKKVNEIFSIVMGGLSVLRDEISKHYIYWHTHNEEPIPHEKVSRIILCGEGANLVGIADYLEGSMMMKVEHGNVWSNISDMEISVPDMIFEESLGYATVLGLACGDYIFT